MNNFKKMFEEQITSGIFIFSLTLVMLKEGSEDSLRIAKARIRAKPHKRVTEL